jgi:hypothetical protein
VRHVGHLPREMLCPEKEWMQIQVLMGQEEFRANVCHKTTHPYVASLGTGDEDREDGYSENRN